MRSHLNIDLYHDPEANAASLRFSHETGRELVTVPVEFVGAICATITFTLMESSSSSSCWTQRDNCQTGSGSHQ